MKSHIQRKLKINNLMISNRSHCGRQDSEDRENKRDLTSHEIRYDYLISWCCFMDIKIMTLRRKVRKHLI